MPIRTPDQPIPARFPAYLWLMPLGGAALSLGFPNEILPGIAGDRPLFFIAWLALIPLLWAVQALPWRLGGRAVFLYGAGFAVCTLSWMRLFGYLPWLLLALYFAAFFSLALFMVRRVDPRLLPLTFALAYAGLEWLRGQGMFGFAWAELGASQVDGVTARIAAVGGLPLLTFLMLWVTGAAVQTVRERRTAPRWQLPAALAVFALCLLAGMVQTRQAVARWEGQPQGESIALIQPSVLRGITPAALQHMPTWAELNRRREKYIGLSYLAMQDRKAPEGYTRLIVWPESALPDQPYSSDINHLCRATDSYLLAGAPSYPTDFTNPGFYNSAYLLGPQGPTGQIYSKMHLVPFGEFVPLRALVARFYTVRPEDLLPGTRRATLTAAGVPLGVGICFESTFPYISRQYANLGAKLLVYITNDAWFHQTNGGRQHFNHARFRALETGLPVARAASTGISGFIAPDGRIIAEIPTYREAFLVRDLHAGIPGMLYTRAGWLFGPASLLAALALAVFSLIQARKKRGS